MAEFTATIRFVGLMIILWKKFRSLIASGEGQIWMDELEGAIKNAEIADSSEKKRDVARNLVDILNRIK